MANASRLSIKSQPAVLCCAVLSCAGFYLFFIYFLFTFYFLARRTQFSEFPKVAAPRLASPRSGAIILLPTYLPTFPLHTQPMAQEVSAFPPYPPLERSSRLATAADLPRIADLSVLGFKDSEIFRFERPRYQEFPQDAVSAFSNIYRTQLLDPIAVVVVVEDLRLPEDDTSATRQAERVVVGVASWDLPEDSPRKGQFVVSNVDDPLPQPDRDLCQRRWELFTRYNKAMEKK
jgi:hypothetical protein